jgi:catechol 2,3-dioxygenase-like lactoylglutathione lyase family enzyme
MAEWKKQIGAVNLIVGDLRRATTFYREVFGLQPLLEEEDVTVFRFEDTYVMLQHGSSHQDVPAEAVMDLARKGVGQFAIIVGEVDAVRADLEARGVTVISGPADRAWGMRTMTFADPGGCVWEIAQPVPDAPGAS